MGKKISEAKVIAAFRAWHRIDTENSYPHVVGDSIKVIRVSDSRITIDYLVDNGHNAEERGAIYDLKWGTCSELAE